MSRDVPDLEILETDVNGQPGILAIVDGVLYLAIVLDVADGRVATIRIVANPDKLSYLSAQLR